MKVLLSFIETVAGEAKSGDGRNCTWQIREAFHCIKAEHMGVCVCFAIWKMLVMALSEQR